MLFYSVLLRNMFPAVIFLMPLIMMKAPLVNALVADHHLPHLRLRFRSGVLEGFYDNIPPQLEQAARLIAHRLRRSS